ncbi:FAD-binding oxidoreductase [Herbiconiux sp. CPCC 203407]|uniref:FAD-binding oxidoreductase n=1 Tax=Herbiconiux oxytropis TaxID=2970915 RepID=A0AA41XFS6_9MICO|nr:FAD-binding oxidoreductase [Herbiconiux oxytropis]MCS5723914.1 FAD-binding oxidoreductase [Herbiconiux oxytropis]MCS5725430.1 FAD-binding oxidoreductase [Herbiconiux oxytropis]
MDSPAFTLPEEALTRFTELLGTERVLVDEAGRDQYRDPYWHHDDRTYDSSAVLLPTTTEEVQGIVRIANELGVPLWTHSQGRNNGYGGPSPRVRGSVLISLRGMNRVLEINRELAYAVVEPGVRWMDLHAALKESGNEDLLVSVPDIGWGSVVGNSLDSGGTYLPLGADFQAPTGMEVVLADGSLLRTGMGAVPESKSWHVYKRGLGPVLDPLFIQSNFGIVTRMGYWLMRRPEAYAPLFLTVPREEQLGQAIDILRDLRLDGIVRGVPVIQNTITLSTHFPELLGEFRGAEAAMPEEELQRIADESGVGRWGVRTALWGDSPVVQHGVDRISRAWAAIEGSQVQHERTFLRHEWDEITHFTDKIQAGIPTLEMLDTIPEGVGHIGFSPVVPLIGAEVTAVVSLLKGIVETRTGRNFTGGLIPINDRSCIIVSGVNMDTTDPASVTQAYEVVRSMITETAALGYGEYRAHIDFMDLASEQYSFGDHAYRRFVERIKDAVDPNGILSPGRHGIWPAGRRDR